jgi:hypothetical protein
MRQLTGNDYQMARNLALDAGGMMVAPASLGDAELIAELARPVELWLLQDLGASDSDLLELRASALQRHMTNLGRATEANPACGAAGLDPLSFLDGVRRYYDTLRGIPAGQAAGNGEKTTVTGESWR